MGSHQTFGEAKWAVIASRTVIPPYPARMRHARPPPWEGIVDPIKARVSLMLLRTIGCVGFDALPRSGMARAA